MFAMVHDALKGRGGKEGGGTKPNEITLNICKIKKLDTNFFKNLLWQMTKSILS